MTASAYHLFEELYQRRGGLKEADIKVEQLAKMLRDELVESKVGGGKFPDLYLNLNPGNSDFPGGEMIEIKDAKSGYNITSFNSTIPSGKKYAKNQWRDTYYLMRGRKKTHVKICFVHGSFFETIPIADNIKRAMQKVLENVLADNDAAKNAESRDAAEKILRLEWQREHLSQVRKTKGAAVSLRFRLMAESMPEANLLHPKHYPKIKDDTLNMIVPADADKPANHAKALMEKAFGVSAGGLPNDLKDFRLTHKINGKDFILFQTSL